MLRLINRALSVDVEIRSGGIVGRTTGDYASSFTHNSISRRHAQFAYDVTTGWTVTDLGSTLGTAVSSTPSWLNIPKLRANEPTRLCNGILVLLGQVECLVSISSDGNQDSDETRRM